MRNKEARISGLGPDNPGREVLGLDSEPGMGAVSVYASIPSRNIGAFVRLSLFAGLMGTRQLLASVICPEGFTGEVFAVSGHLADSWHVFASATNTQSDVGLGIMSLECCGPPKVWAPAGLLALPLLDDASFPPGFADGPFVPAGDDFGAAGAVTLVGSTLEALPAGARITHWIAECSAPGVVTFVDASGGERQILLVANQRYEGFPAGRWPAASVAISNALYSLFEYVV